MTPTVHRLTRALACLVLAAAAATAADPWISGYVFGNNAGGNGNEPTAVIPYGKYTHIIHSQVDAHADGTLDEAELAPSESAAVVGGAHAAGAKALFTLSPNGDNHGATGSGTIDTLVANLVSFANRRGYDGIDLDWESNIDVQQYASLIRKVRAALGPGRPLTIAAYGGGNSPLQAVVAAGADQVDQVNIMTYDEDIFAPTTWFNEAVRTGPNGFTSVTDAWAEFTRAGVPAAKLGIGVAFYGRHYTGANGPLQGGATRAGSTTYHGLVESGLLTPANDHYDTTFGASWLSAPGSNDFYPYTSTREIGEIVAFGRAHGAGGYMAFELEYEYLPSAGGDARYPLSTALRNAVGGATQQAPSIASFTAAPASIAAGGSSTLAWTTANATSVSISGVGSVAASGSVSVAPTATTIYTLSATGGGQTVSATQTVTVTATTATAAIGSFTASPATIAAGGATTLAWSTSNAASVSISGVGAVAATGSLSVAPAATTTYTLTASGGGATVTATRTVTVTAVTTGGGPLANGHVYKLIAKHSGKVLDVAGGPSATQDGANVQQWTDVGGTNQQWRAIANADGSWTFLAVNSGKALDVAGWSTAPGGNVIQWSSHGGANQCWRVADTGGGWCTLTNVNSGEVLDVQGGVGATQDGANVEQWPWQAPGADNERWRFVDLGAGGAIVSGQWYKVVSKHSGKLLAVAGSSTANSANVWQWHDDGTTGEGWRIDAVGDGSYTLTARCSGQVLDVENLSLADGANVSQYPSWGGANQRWKLEDTGAGWYRITSVNSGKVLDVAGVSTSDGANVQQWTDWGGDNQRWELVPMAPSGNG